VTPPRTDADSRPARRRHAVDDSDGDIRQRNEAFLAALAAREAVPVAYAGPEERRHLRRSWQPASVCRPKSLNLPCSTLS
jgi:hypothetical protein